MVSLRLPRFRKTNSHTSPASHSSSQTGVATAGPALTDDQVKRATRPRKVFSLITVLCYLLAIVFLILVEYGTTSNQAVARDTFFVKIDLRNIVPASIPNAAVLNSIAQTLGLHDFYQVGLWGFCAGSGIKDVTYCSSPKLMYWFNPVQIIRDELVAGATVNLPQEINDILDLVKLASNIMFGLFLTGACLSAVLAVMSPLNIYSRWWSFAISILAFLNALFITAASIVATVMFTLFHNKISEFDQLNIHADIGKQMFAFMWTASAFALVALLIELSLCCCCASRRDVRTGRKKGSKKAYGPSTEAEKAA